jgi:hypothetical protein
MPGVNPRCLVILAASMRPTSTHIALCLDLGAHQCLIEPPTTNSWHTSKRARFATPASPPGCRGTSKPVVHSQRALSRCGCPRRRTAHRRDFLLVMSAPVVEHRVVEGPSLKDRYGIYPLAEAASGGAWNNDAPISPSVRRQGTLRRVARPFQTTTSARVSPEGWTVSRVGQQALRRLPYRRARSGYPRGRPALVRGGRSRPGSVATAIEWDGDCADSSARATQGCTADDRRPEHMNRDA